MNSLSDQEVDQHEQDNTHQDMRGIGRSYECVFCKRGFNTAQALGGHMNIHRKDKARNKPSSTHSLLNSKHEIQNSLTGANLRCYQQVSSYIPTYHEAVTDYSSCLTYFPASSTSTDVHNRQCLNLFGDNWGMNLSLQFGAAANVIESTMGKNGQENNLDLELRLGHHDP